MSETRAYFDNAATTYPKPKAVYDYADSFYRNSGGSAGRGGNALAASASAVSRSAKENLLTIFNCPAKKVAFTASATDALNRIILGLNLERGDCVYVTPFEHNAVTRPLNYLEHERGVEIKVLDFDSRSLLPDLEAIGGKFKDCKPRLVILNHASNVCGAVVPVLDIARLAKRYGAIVAVDMSQTAGLVPLDLSSSLIDFGVFAGHKTLMGPFGIGGFVCDGSLQLDPVLFGGNGINSVEQAMPKDIVQMTEVGSQNAYAIAGLKAATDYILDKGVDGIFSRESNLRDTLIKILRQYENIHIIGDEMECARIGVVSTTFDGYSPDEVEMILDRLGVSVRSGLQCAPYAHRFLGTLPSGTVRFSVSALTSPKDFSVLEEALDCIRDEG